MSKFVLYIQNDFDNCVILLNNAIAKATVSDDRTITFTSDFDSITIDRDTLLNARSDYSDMIVTRVFTHNGIIYRIGLLQNAHSALDRIVDQLYDYD